MALVSEPRALPRTWPKIGGVHEGRRGDTWCREDSFGLPELVWTSSHGPKTTNCALRDLRHRRSLALMPRRGVPHVGQSTPRGQQVRRADETFVAANRLGERAIGLPSARGTDRYRSGASKREWNGSRTRDDVRRTRGTAPHSNGSGWPRADRRGGDKNSSDGSPAGARSRCCPSHGGRFHAKVTGCFPAYPRQG